jgi:hypothetical protein
MTHEQIVSALVTEFRNELARLHSRMAWPHYETTRLSLVVEFSADKARAWIEHNAGYGHDAANVKGATLGAVMDEIYRRTGYQDREDGRIATSLQAIEGPKED